MHSSSVALRLSAVLQGHRYRYEHLAGTRASDWKFVEIVMTPEQIHLIRASFSPIVAEAVVTASLFYDRLFAHGPGHGGDAPDQRGGRDDAA